MDFGLNSIKRWTVTLLVGAGILLGTAAGASAQFRRNGPPYGRAYGYYSHNERRANRNYRKSLRRNLRFHQQDEREAFRYRMRREHNFYGNNGAWRNERHAERIALRGHQRAEREELREDLRNNRRRPH